MKGGLPSFIGGNKERTANSKQDHLTCICMDRPCSDLLRCLVVFSALRRVLLRSLELKSLYSIVLPVGRYLQNCKHSARLSAAAASQLCSSGLSTVSRKSIAIKQASDFTVRFSDSYGGFSKWQHSCVSGCRSVEHVLFDFIIEQNFEMSMLHL